MLKPNPEPPRSSAISSYSQMSLADEANANEAEATAATGGGGMAIFFMATSKVATAAAAALELLEAAMEEEPMAGVSVELHDRRREGTVVLLGTVAKHLAKGDSKVRFQRFINFTFPFCPDAMLEGSTTICKAEIEKPQAAVAFQLEGFSLMSAALIIVHSLRRVLVL